MPRPGSKPSPASPRLSLGVCIEGRNQERMQQCSSLGGPQLIKTKHAGRCIAQSAFSSRSILQDRGRGGSRALRQGGERPLRAGVHSQKFVPGQLHVRLPPPLGKEGWEVQWTWRPRHPSHLNVRAGRRPCTLREKGASAYHSTSTVTRVPRRPSAW